MIIRKIKSAIKTIKYIGLYNFILGNINLIFYTLLKPIFGFEEWHRSNPYHFRPYKKYVIDLINELNPKTTIEVGCGLGEMLEKVCIAFLNRLEQLEKQPMNPFKKQII